MNQFTVTSQLTVQELILSNKSRSLCLFPTSFSDSTFCFLLETFSLLSTGAFVLAIFSVSC
jgi:hypothetical protein